MNLTHNIGGYILLVLLAILAPTPIPIPLDGIIVGLIKSGFNPTVVLAVASIGDVIGTIFIFFVGKKGRALLNSYRKKKKRTDYILAEQLFSKYGQYALLLSGIPFLGDALIFLAGFFRLKFKKFLVWFLIGKAIWYLLLWILYLLTKRSFFY